MLGLLRKMLRKEPYSRDQVRAWLATVIIPVIDGAKVEGEFAFKENWSFRGYSGDFEHLRYVREMADRRYNANFYQFLACMPRVQEVVAGHDLALTALEEGCVGAYDELMKDNGFRELVDKCGVNEEGRDFLAECVVNNLQVQDLDHISPLFPLAPLADCWRDYREEFLALREDPELVEYFRELQKQGERFTKRARGLVESFEQYQKELADRYGFPRAGPFDV